MKVKTRDFTNLLTIKKTFEWDPAVLRFTGINTPYMMNVSGFPSQIRNDFDTSLAVSDGKLAWDWEDMTGVSFTIPSGTIEDNYVLFEICFESIGSFGASTQIMTAIDPIPVVTRLGTGGINIGCYSENGLVGTDVLPVKFKLSSPEPNQGDLFCVDVTVENFFEIGSMQFTIAYDSTVLEPDGFGISTYPPPNGIPGFTPIGTTAIPRPGFITLSFFNRAGPQTLPDGSLAFAICFRAIGDCDDYSFVDINSDLTNLIITSGLDPDPSAGTNIAAVVERGLVRINPCDQTGDVRLSTDCPEAAPGDIICLDVEASGFDDLTEADFLVKFNPGVLAYQNATFPSAFQPTIDANASNIGTLGVKWKSRTPTQGITVPDGNDIMQLCFEVIGDGTVGSTISFTGAPQPFFSVQGSNRNVGMIAQNGCVRVKAPPGLTLSADDYEGFKGDEVCVDVKVANFVEISQMVLSMNYAANVVEFLRVENFGIPRLTASNFNDLGGGNIGINWDANMSGFGETVNDGETAFTACFRIIGDPTQPPLLPNCSIIEFSDDPVDVNIESSETGPGFNIGLNSNPGNICVKDPGAFTVVGSDEVGDLGDRVCVDVSVVNCNEITSFQFSSNWNSGFGDPLLDFDAVEVTGMIPGLTASNFDLSNTNVGLLTVSWQNNQGISLPDNTVIFRACFNIIGPPNQCTDFAFDENPLPVYVTSSLSGANDIGLTGVDGSACTGDYLRIVEGVVTNVGCPGADNGVIFLNVAGGSDPYNFQWSNGLTATGNTVDNLSPGTYSVTMTDSGSPQKTVIDSFEVIVSGTAPVAEAGDPVSLNCNNLPVVLDGSASSGGSNIVYQWTTVDGGLVTPSDRTATPNVTGEGTYILEVMNISTNCVAYDTVMVLPAVSDEGADAGDDQSTNCYDDTALLDGSNSVGDNLRYSWASINGGTLDPATDSVAIAVATSPGLFELTVINVQTGCSGKDTVRVTQDDFPPIADGGPIMSIPCRADTITIGGTNTSAANVTYQWTEVTGGNIVGDTDGRTAQVNSAGIYELLVIDTLNGCEATSTVEVIGDPNRPISDAGADTTLTCDRNAVMIGGGITSVGGQFLYFWEAFGGGVLGTNDTNRVEIMVDEPGNYQLTVVNQATGCSSISNVAVSSFRTLPTVFAGSDITYNCDPIQLVLDGAGSSLNDNLNPDLYDYTWTNDNGALITTPKELTSTAVGTGNFIFEVLNTENGCSARDTMVVRQDTLTSKPIVTIAAPTQTITCNNNEVTLNAIGSDNGADYTISWGPAQFIQSGRETLTPTVTEGGIYTLSIINDLTQCFTTETILVETDTVAPMAIIPQDDFELPCDPAEVALSTVGSSVGADIDYEWTLLGTGVLSPSSLLSPVVTETGTYILKLEDRTNGCSATDTTNVIPAPSGILAEAGDALALDCNNDEFDITGTGSSTDPGLDVFWVNQMTNDTVARALNWTVQDSGVYKLLIVDDKGCFAEDFLVVTKNTDEPTVSAGDAQTFNCFFDLATLEGTYDAGGANVTIEWTSPDGNPISDPAALMPTVTEPGIYNLNVQNTDNGCSQSASVEIIVNSAGLEAATADFDTEACTNFAILTANLPANATGVWTAGAGFLDDLTDPMPTTNDLPVGTSEFVWTLSTADCPDYSSTSVFVNITGTAGNLILRNDVVLMNAETDTIEVDFVRNDDIDATGNWSITLLDTAAAGTLIPLADGSFTYIREDDYEGSFDLTYEVCNLDCPDACDTAFIKIRVQAAMNTIPDRLPPNAITPNGDGLNETLIFDIIETSSEEFPDNELTVFNRWGDIVHKSRPYNNDWAGTGRNGKILPQGTYYYILRLNVAEGDIIRGDVTIMK